MIRKLDHVGIAVQSLERSLPFWADALGLEVCGIETVDDESVKVAFLAAGPSRIELLEPTAPSSAVARSIAKRGEGVHHVTLEVADLETALARLRSRGIAILGDASRVGAGGRRVAFLHPDAAGGVLVELVAGGGAVAGTHELAPGSAALLYLREPHEKLWGVLRRLDVAGVVLEGVDLGSFDDWVRQIERGEEDTIGPSVLFMPMVRVEKILLDRRSGELPSLAERFEQRTGQSVQTMLEARGR